MYTKPRERQSPCNFYKNEANSNMCLVGIDVVKLK